MTLNDLNNLPLYKLKETLFSCCGSTAWVEGMAAAFPFHETANLMSRAKAIWNECSEKDWLEAFTYHPKIGDLHVITENHVTTSGWASEEQAGVERASVKEMEELAEGNRAYEEKFGYIFIVCATGKPPGEMLDLLKARLTNTPEKEIGNAMAEQSKITEIRLTKLLTA